LYVVLRSLLVLPTRKAQVESRRVEGLWYGLKSLLWRLWVVVIPRTVMAKPATDLQNLQSRIGQRLKLDFQKVIVQNPIKAFVERFGIVLRIVDVERSIIDRES
jgi:hypothetical protein